MIPVEVVTGLLVRDGRVLMCQRHSQKIYPLHWEFPGGKVEPNETLLEALQREISEELHLDCHEVQEYFEDTMTYSNGITYHVTFFVITDFTGTLVNTEFNDLGWFSSEELKDLLHLSGNTNIIEKLITEGIPNV